MNLIDAGIVIFVLALAAVGYERGLIASALPLAGFVGGAALGARLAPALLADGAESPYAPLVGVLAGLSVGAFLAVALDGVAGAVRARLVLAGGALRVADGIGGAALLAGFGLLLAWGFGAVALHLPADGQSLREAVQRSSILAALNEALPPSGPLLNVLRRVDPNPVVRGPEPAVAPPPRRVLADPDVRAAADSTVRVVGTACGLGLAGSGWVAAPGLVVTNAHVVAGEDETTVVVDGQGELEAEPVHYEPRNDLAILRVAGLEAAPLELHPEPRRGAAGAVVGYPENGPRRLGAARLGETVEVTSEDSYGRGPVRRLMTPFRGQVRSGNSGGPVIDADGRVLTTVFAATSAGGVASGLGIPNEVVAAALAGRLRPTETGPCAA